METYGNMINSRIATGDITCYMGLSYLSLVIDFVFNIIQPYSSALGTGSPGCFTPKSPAPVTAETPTDRKFLATDVPPSTGTHAVVTVALGNRCRWHVQQLQWGHPCMTCEFVEIV